MAFLRNLLATILGFFIATGILFFGFLIFISIMSSSDEEALAIKDNSILEIDLDQPIEDYGGTYTAENFEYSESDYSGLFHILKAIDIAKTDDKIKGISIHNTSGTQGGIATIKALRDALISFKESGKFVYSYGDMYTQKDYYLSSVADSIYINPIGDFEFKGLASEVLFFKDLQDNTGVKMEVIRHGKYKSAVEPFLQNSMSEANREQITALLTSVWNTILDDVSNSRNISKEQLNSIADDLAARTPQKALSTGLADVVAYQDEYESLLRNKSGLSDNDDLEFVDIFEYSDKKGRKAILNKPNNKIAVIFAQGEIMYGKGSNQVIGQEIMIESLRDAREDDDVKGIVLRVNSPGGSALASDIIWREIEITKKEKPVYVSMGNYAASGGYYISCGAEKIIAEPNTITGSIGVFGMLPNVKGLADKWGIHAEQVQTNKNAAGYSVFQELDGNTKEVILEGIETIYETFVNKVAEGRNMTFEEVDAIAQGRVWSGTDAIKNGLVDKLGGLETTVNMLAEDKNIGDFTIETYPKYEVTLGEIIIKNLTSPKTELTQEAIKAQIGEETYQVIEQLKQFQEMKGIQARLPFELRIH
ncbi:protease-4 [Pustulibacterium marinum]|uniref:Protease-4 n=1 Tax=Pustulibacterium marinum TaxID=1224947 RepID=A0A1I7GQL1_9FLAO|nr:signal peptide peptidase SppA [Pustulibacterium marinum]SFU50744.1 protease-4 [Pustulibacterium marinum]